MTPPLAHPLLCTSAVFAALMLAGCGSNAPLLQNEGAVPAVVAVALQVNGNAPNRKQEVQFSGPMDPATINAHSFQVADSGGNPMPGAVTYDSNFDIASFQPTPALRPGTTYTATLTTAATSAAGVPVAKPYSYTFTTRAKTDASPISVLSVSPAANATCVSANSLIIVTFDEAPDAATILPSNFVVTGPGGAIPVKLSMNVTTTQVVLTPSSPLPSGNITVTVNNVGDLADVMMTSPYTWSFSTACTSGGGTTGGATAQYLATLFGSEYIMNGQVSIDTNGNTTIQLTGAPANTTYTADFCPALNVATNPNLACFTVAKLSSDTAGNATVTFKFPRSGNWAGDFFLNNPASNTPYENAAYSTSLHYTVTHQVYLSTLFLATSVNTGTAMTSPQNSASFGTVSYSNGLLKFNLSGGSPNTNYTTTETLGVAFDSSNTYQVTTFTTNAQGDGTSTSTQLGAEGDLFQVVTGNPNLTAFIGGFSVPN